jgi:hypothetical protein
VNGEDVAQVVTDEASLPGIHLGEGDFPEELRALNWGAVLTSFYWALFHGLWRWVLGYLAIIIVSMAPLLGSKLAPAPTWAIWFAGRLAVFYVTVTLGYRGNRRVWDRARERSARQLDKSAVRPAMPVSKYARNQRTWAWWGVALLVYAFGSEVWRGVRSGGGLPLQRTLGLASWLCFLGLLFAYDRLFRRMPGSQS